METDAIVVVSLNAPREKVWGRLLSLSGAGVTLQGIDLNCFDDWMRQVMEAQPASLPLSTVFYPMHRVERISLDESSGAIPSIAQQFHGRVGISLLDYLALSQTP